MFKENFSNSLSAHIGDATNPKTARSFLNGENKNLYNSIYCPALDPNFKGFITKKNFDFTDNTVTLDPYYSKGFNGTTSNEGVCLEQCKKNKYCGSYRYDSTKSENNCALYSNLPNTTSEKYGSNIGYKVDKGYSFDNLNDKQQENIWKKCGSFWLSKKYDISGNNIDKCISPELINGKLKGYNTNAECLWNTLSPQNDDLKKNYKQKPVYRRSISFKIIS